MISIGPSLGDLSRFAMPGPDPVAEYRRKLFEQIYADGLSACRKTDVADLTEGEKFAVAYYAGVPLQPPPSFGDEWERRLGWNSDARSMNFTLTTVPCAIHHNGEKWIVAMRAEDER